MLVAGCSHKALDCPLPLILLLSSFFLPLCFAGMLLLLSQAYKGLTPLAPLMYTKQTLPRCKQFQARIKNN